MRLLISFLVFLLAISSCGVTYEIVTDRAHEVNFEKYRTFDIIHDDHGFEKGANPINKQRIDRAIEEEFRAIGYTYSTSPDLKISWFIKVNTKLEQGIYNAYYQKWRYPKAIDVYEYQEGSLVIDILDAHTGKVDWHAKASSKVEEDMPNVEDKIKEVVKAMFNSYKKDTGINKINGYVLK